ncbi:MAG: hypothetical protein FWH52_06025, partial [Synergistaceae bacterium]|nr:hypothetical protein [Synergistaceae bacterium]
KSVPQYAVAIMTGHATADGGLARAAVMAGVGTAATVWNISRGVSQIAINTAKATHSAANAFGNQVVSVGVNKDGKDLGTTKGAVLGALSAVKAFAAYPLNGQGKSSGERGYALSSASNNTGGNEMKAGSAIFNDAQKAARMYHSE